jgi:hypothetical protein
MMGPWCPGSDIRIVSRLARLRMPEPRGHQQTSVFSAVFDLAFAMRVRGKTEANAKSSH